MIHLAARDYLLREGDAPTCCFLVERGRVEVLLERAGGDRVLATLGPGEIVGEMALIDRAPRTASVRACEASVLLPITAEHLTKRLAASDPVLQLVLSTVLDRLRATLDGIGERPVSMPAFARRNAVMDVAALAGLRVEREFEAALEEGQIRVVYQPIVRLSDGQLTGFEALARWLHPSRGMVSPAVFVPIAEASGLSARLANVCLRQVLADLPVLRRRAAACAGHVGDLHVSVNISGYDLTTPDFIDSLATAAEVDASGIVLELTETALVHSTAEATEALAKARSFGFRVAVDDFGTGYSSLTYIRLLPVDGLKIDRSFVQGMTDCATTRSIVASMLQLAASLDLRVVGEGIETAGQRSLLRMLGCEFGQGYLFGRPLPLDQTLQVLAAWRADAPDHPLTCDPSA